MVAMLSSRTTVYSTILFLSLNAGMLTLDRIKTKTIVDDLIRWNVTCDDMLGCREVYNSLGAFFNCHCDRKCTLLGTCCADSTYRTRYGLGAGIFSCRNPNRDSGIVSMWNPVFMLDRCRRNWKGEDFIQDLCLGDGKAMNDPLLLVPVTSPRTGITYRNYFCFACNEDSDTVSPILWKLELYSEFKNITGDLQTNLQYKESMKQWTIRGTGVTVNLVVNIPKEFEQCLVRCEESVIQTCAEGWTDLVTKEKCETYMALVYRVGGINEEVYRNPHCAFCNFLNVSDCNVKRVIRLSGTIPAITLGGALPPLIREFYLELENRCGRYEMFDPFSKKCRAVRCGSIQVWYQGECRNRRF